MDRNVTAVKIEIVKDNTTVCLLSNFDSNAESNETYTNQTESFIYPEGTDVESIRSMYLNAGYSEV